MTTAPDVLTLTAGMPERRLAVGDVLFAEGAASVDAGAAVLVNGALDVVLGDATIAEITVPGAFVGEIAALLDTPRTATIRAREPSTIRVVGDPVAFFSEHPDVALELARQLAGRLQRLLAYLGDVRAQYQGSEGHLAVFDAVLGRLASRPPVEIDAGSDRSPDY